MKDNLQKNNNNTSWKEQFKNVNDSFDLEANGK